MTQSGVRDVFEAAVTAAAKTVKGPQKTENRNCTTMWICYGPVYIVFVVFYLVKNHFKQTSLVSFAIA